ncbi:alpha-1D adrenergic receptor-like [Dendronephthya gigantea]|uniref:alpha-1D adrenergic receptor-like n=1 Tax=Dendronephthya gigantea TaxID=151771 RepID=UPI00106AED61|nr:alpha-1D adrenergic receptor-like [Dendronephthya gigantea]XP_028391101.1 alpha-1D adrenergic receptor-like [Dendronephthya gigantea]XP_028391102.1 alpha-1D adrenergic receptor-like [Dendronephthya gigantea]
MGSLSFNESTEDCEFPINIAYPTIVVNIIGSLLGTFANILVWFAVLKNTQLQTLSNYFLLNLSAADLLVTAVTQPLFVAHNILAARRECLDTVDNAYSAIASFACMASILNVTTISIDRLIVLKYPLQKKAILTKRRGFAVMALTWVLATLYAALSCVLEERKTWISLTFGYFAVCYSIMISAHTHMYVVSHRFVRRRKQQVRRYSFSAIAYSKERQAAKTIAIILAVLTLTWLPYGSALAVSAVTGMRLKQRFVNPLLTVGFLNSCFNTVLYSWRNKEIRMTFRQLLKCQDPNLIRRESVSSFYIRRSRLSTTSSMFNDINGQIFDTKEPRDDMNQPSFVVGRQYSL